MGTTRMNVTISLRKSLDRLREYFDVSDRKFGTNHFSVRRNEHTQVQKNRSKKSPGRRISMTRQSGVCFCTIGHSGPLSYSFWISGDRRSDQDS